MGKFKDYLGNYTNAKNKRLKGIEVGFYDGEWDPIHTYTKLPGWALKNDEGIADGYWISFYVTGKDGQLRNVGIRLEENALWQMIDEIEDFNWEKEKAARQNGC